MTMTRRHLLLLLLPAGVLSERAARQKLQMAGPAVINTPTRLASVRRQLRRRLQQPLLALVLLALGMCRLRLGMVGAVRWWLVMMGGGMLAPVLLLMMMAGACRSNPRLLTHASQTQHMQHQTQQQQQQQQQQQILHRAQQSPNRLQLPGGAAHPPLNLLQVRASCRSSQIIL